MSRVRLFEADAKVGVREGKGKTGTERMTNCSIEESIVFTENGWDLSVKAQRSDSTRERRISDCGEKKKEDDQQGRCSRRANRLSDSMTRTFGVAMSELRVRMQAATPREWAGKRQSMGGENKLVASEAEKMSKR